ncbi:MAG: phage portal protein, partial [Mesorhizobium sp.]
MPSAPMRPQAFDAGKSARRLSGVPNSSVAINALIRRYGRSVLARSRYLAENNPYAAAAKETFVSALVGSGIKPSSLVKDAALKGQIQEAWLDWTDETDADGLTDLYGQQALIAAEMFEAGECFVRLRARRVEDGLTIPLQLQLLPAE